MAVYQELARRYVHDYERLAGADHVAGDRSRAELSACMIRLNETYASLQTRGRARFNVKVWQSDLARRMLELRDRQIDPEWRALRAELPRLMGRAMFSEASERMKNLPVDGALALDQREVLVWLADAASAFLQNVQRQLAADAKGVTLMTRGGKVLESVLGSRPDGVLVRQDGSERLLGWGELAPVTLLRIHENHLEGIASRFEKHRRIEEAAAFAELSGLHGEADRLAGVLAGIHPGFAARWEASRARLRAE